MKQGRETDLPPLKLKVSDVWLCGCDIPVYVVVLGVNMSDTVLTATYLVYTYRTRFR